ncbi:hypothetical protein CVT26_012702 [Gymnopilus dilepis]|uniref:Uncharacterized protein n=1 Tax=Gymnopilus dilepis TaxID=231916 RepID=A0A409YPE3_9AGAR|nr:hypothetical protein CVT26_012702 [Gymnopilus dilepis]
MNECSSSGPPKLELELEETQFEFHGRLGLGAPLGLWTLEGVAASDALWAVGGRWQQRNLETWNLEFEFWRHGQDDPGAGACTGELQMTRAYVDEGEGKGRLGSGELEAGSGISEALLAYSAESFKSFRLLTSKFVEQVQPESNVTLQSPIRKAMAISISIAF